MTDQRVDVAIVGGGIGGLSTAVALARRGLEAHVFEAAPALREVGAGIWVPPNAMQVLDRLGLAEAVSAAGGAIERAEIREHRGGLLQAMDMADVSRRFGFPTIALHRTRLQGAIAEAIQPNRLHLGRACRDVVLEMDGSVRARFEDGPDVVARVLVGADGLRSVVRQQVFPAASLRYSGQTSYRAVVEASLPPELERVACETWGPGRRFGYSTIGAGQVYWFAVEDAAAGGRDAPGAAKARLAALFTDFPEPIPTLLGALDEDRLTLTDIYDLRPIASWHRGAVVLVGDAAHATTPNLGQGGAQAIESAWVLADRLATLERPEDAFIAYERVRMPKARKVVARSWQLGKIAHLRNPVARAARDLLVRSIPEARTRRELEALYALDY